MIEYSRRALLVGGAVGVGSAAVAVAAFGARASQATVETARPTPSPAAPPPPSPTAAPTAPPPPPPPVMLGPPAQVASLVPRTSGAVLQQVEVCRTGELFTTQSREGTAEGRYTTVIARSTGPATSATANPELDAMVVVDGGHGLGLHVEPRPDGGHDVWMSLQGPVPQSDPNGGRLARFAYTPGTWAIDGIPGGVTWLPQFPNDAGAPQEAVYAFDWDRGFAVERMFDFTTGRQERYTRRRISDLVQGVDAPCGRMTLPVNAPTLQGFATVDSTLFRWVGLGNGGSGAPVPSDPMALEQFDWVSGVRTAITPFPTLGQVDGAWPGGAYEPEGCSVLRSPDGSAALILGVTTGPGGHHAWPVFAVPLGARA
ncbi:phage baseplate protein [Amnibacterium setariae]|uniref:phage baseplate protein n=1 Tax=Amnibacterium setariae TaxID=2306585 RepID=UPI0018F6A52B|nr:hypothetical protein [Amnibacterium setariae]